MNIFLSIDAAQFCSTFLILPIVTRSSLSFRRNVFLPLPTVCRDLLFPDFESDHADLFNIMPGPCEDAINRGRFAVLYVVISSNEFVQYRPGVELLLYTFCSDFNCVTWLQHLFMCTKFIEPLCKAGFPLVDFFRTNRLFSPLILYITQ